MKKRWVASDAWRGRYEPVPPEGWRLLADCSVVNESGEQCRDILAKWLRKNKIKYRSGYMETSNVFSANMYVIVDDEAFCAFVDCNLLGDPMEVARDIDDWFVDQTTGTFSIFSGESWPLDIEVAQRKFDTIVEAS